MERAPMTTALTRKILSITAAAAASGAVILCSSATASAAPMTPTTAAPAASATAAPGAVSDRDLRAQCRRVFHPGAFYFDHGHRRQRPGFVTCR